MIIVVCSVVVVHQDKYLMVLENKRDAVGKYGIPGGQLEHKETLIDCAKRELREETGFEASDLEIIAVTHKPYTRSQNSVIRFVFRAKKIELSKTIPELQIDWLSWNQIIELERKNMLRGDDVKDILKSKPLNLTINTY